MKLDFPMYSKRKYSIMYYVYSCNNMWSLLKSLVMLKFESRTILRAVQYK